MLPICSGTAAGTLKIHSDPPSPFLHTQDLLAAIAQNTIDVCAIQDPILKAVANVLQLSNRNGTSYSVKGNPLVKDLKFCLIGKNHSKITPITQDLGAANLYNEPCQSCSKPTILIQISLKIAGEIRIGFLTIECGEIRVRGEIFYEDLLRGSY